MTSASGFFWLASRPAIAAEWSSAGGIVHLGSAGTWWAATDRRFWPQDPQTVRELEALVGRGPFGDRRQELVFIGMDLDKAELRARLQAALLTDDEQGAGMGAWAALPDPWPSWSAHDQALPG